MPLGIVRVAIERRCPFCGVRETASREVWTEGHREPALTDDGASRFSARFEHDMSCLHYGERDVNPEIDVRIRDVDMRDVDGTKTVEIDGVEYPVIFHRSDILGNCHDNIPRTIVVDRLVLYHEEQGIVRGDSKGTNFVTEVEYSSAGEPIEAQWYSFEADLDDLDPYKGRELWERDNNC